MPAIDLSEEEIDQLNDGKKIHKSTRPVTTTIRPPCENHSWDYDIVGAGSGTGSEEGTKMIIVERDCRACEITQRTEIGEPKLSAEFEV